MITTQTYSDVLAEYLSQPISLRPQWDDFMQKSAKAAAGDIINLRLTELYRPVIRAKMCSLLADQYPLAATLPDLVPAQVQMSALLRVMDETEGGKKLREEYPELARLDHTVRHGFENLIEEVLSILEEKRGEISRLFFSGRDFGRVTAVRLPGRRLQKTRTRPGGHMTLLIETESGMFFYKPHSCKVNQVYSRFTARFFPELYTGSQSIDCGNASLVEFMTKIPLTSEAEAEIYYTRMGLLAAIYYGLGGRDLHSDNIIPHGSVPAPIDLEVLLGQVMPGSKLSPFIEMAQKQRDTFASPLYAVTGNDNDKEAEEKGHLPCLNGRIITVEGFEDAFIAGFADGFRRIRENSEEIISLLEEASDTPILTAIRSRWIYPKILYGMLQPERLRSRAALETWLEKIWSVLPEQDQMLYRELEHDDLLNLDYPHFYLLIGDGTVYHIDGKVGVRDALPVPLECVKARFNLLSEECLEGCVQTLRQNLTSR